MRWEDERYVKLYTRDTLTTKRLGWEGRAVLWELFRKVDRVGLAEIGDEDPVQALSGLTGIPPKVCEVAWARLSGGKTPVVTLRDGNTRAFFIANYLPAQEAKQSDRARQEKHRELARGRELAAALAVGVRDETSQDVGGRDIPSQNETNSHDRSHDVTPSLAVLRQDLDPIDHSKSGESEGRELTACESVDNSTLEGLTNEQKAQVQRLFDKGEGPQAITLLASFRAKDKTGPGATA